MSQKCREPTQIRRLRFTLKGHCIHLWRTVTITRLRILVINQKSNCIKGDFGNKYQQIRYLQVSKTNANFSLQIMPTQVDFKPKAYSQGIHGNIRNFTTDFPYSLCIARKNVFIIMFLRSKISKRSKTNILQQTKFDRREFHVSDSYICCLSISFLK